MSDDAKKSARTVTLTRHATSVAARQAVGVVTIVHPPELARRIELRRDGLTLGRESEDPECALDHATVSRRHLAISWDGRSHAHVVADLESRNGSWLDGSALSSARSAVRDGAVLRVGGVVAVYEKVALAAESVDDAALGEIIAGESAAMRRLRRQIVQAAGDPSPALITGPTGAGKEHVARALHRLSGRDGPWVAVNVAELSPQLAESQLFGHVRGAFTGAAQAQTGLFRAAEGGTIFLDEIGELSLELQPKLLRVIQEREVRPVGATRAEPFDARIVAATQRDLVADVEADRFRRDLWARLSLWELVVPPLSARRADILGWVTRLHARWCSERGRPVEPLAWTAEAVEALLLADFPDNLRGLDRVVHRLAVEQAAAPITRETIEGLVGKRGAGEGEAAQAVVRRAPPADAAELSIVLEREGGVMAAARWYGCDRRQVYRWMDAFGLRGGPAG